MKLTRQIQFWRNGERDWDAPMIVDDFRWEDPDVLILNAEGKILDRVRVGAAELNRGWRGGSVWIPDQTTGLV